MAILNTSLAPEYHLAQKSLGFRAWLVWGIAVLFYCYEFLLQVSPNVLAPELAREFQTSAVSLGQLAAFYFYAYALMQIPVGLLIDRFNTRIIICTAVLICAAGTYLFAIADTLLLAKIGRLLTGIGSAFAVISCLKIATLWFPTRRFALLAGLMMTVGMAGAIFGEAPLALLIKLFSWRNSLLLLAGIGVMLCILIFLCVRDRPKHTNFIPAAETTPLNVWQALSTILRCPQTWLLSIYGCFIYAAIAALGALWGVSFLVAKYGIEHTEAATIISLLFVGFAIGAPLLGWFSDYIGRRKPILYIASIGTCLSLSIFIYAPFPKGIIALSLFVCGFSISGLMAAFTILKEISPHQSNATAMAFMNMLNMLGAAAVQPFIGLLLDYFWQGEVTREGALAYSLEHYIVAFSILPLISFLSLILVPFVKETYCRHKIAE